jgi:cold shock CspA family protein
MAVTGSVSRWFNRKGYGFINVMNSDSEHCGKDIFVHLSGINVKNDGYKCLYPGEYVSFDLTSGKDGKLVGTNVSGVMGGSLLVEHPDFMFKYSPKNRSQDSTNDRTEKDTEKDTDKDTEKDTENA